ncbi:MAG: hypothetical protein QXI05_00605 [Candidatus Bathyarchaeia archaeon]
MLSRKTSISTTAIMEPEISPVKAYVTSRVNGSTMSRYISVFFMLGLHGREIGWASHPTTLVNKSYSN